MSIDLLLVDDESAFLEQSNIFLKNRESSFNIYTALSGDSALEILEDEDIDVIVSDYQMPGMNGIELLQRIREERGRDIPFIIFTGKGREEVAMKALNLGADRYMQKGGDPKSQYGVLADAIVQEYEHFQSEKNYKRVVENSHDAIFVYKEDVFLFANERAAAITGYDRERLLDMNLLELIHPDLEDGIKNFLEEESEKVDLPYKFETKIITKSGDLKHLHITISTIWFKGKEAFLGSARDITDLKKAQKEREEYISQLRSERNFLERIAETSPVGITEVNGKGEIIYANEEAEKVLGLSESELKGRTYDDPDWQITDYEGEEYPKEKLPFNQVKETEEPVYDVRHVIEWPGGERKFLSINAAPLHDEKGNFDGMVSTIEDVTEKVKKERELEETKNWLSGIIEGISVPAFVIDEDHKVTHWNRACEELTGLPKEEMIGTTETWKAFYKEERPVLADMLVDDASKKEIDRWYGDKVQESPLLADSYRGEEWFELKDELVCIFYTTSPIKNSKGERIGAVETLQDITKRKEAERDLKREQERLLRLMDNIPGMAYRCAMDENRTMKFLSDGCEELTGYEPEDLVDNEVIAYSDLIHPGDKDDLREEIRASVENNELFETEYRIRTSSGEIKWVWERGKAVQEEDGFLEGIITDITERKEMEIELKQRKRTLENSINGIAIADLDGEVRYVNPALLDMFGHDEEEKIVGENTIDFFYDEEKAAEAIGKVIEDGEWQGELEGVKSDGDLIDVYLSANLIKDQKGDPSGLLGTMVDISERKEKEKKLQRERKKFEEIFNNANDAIYLHRLTEEGMPGSFVEVNDIACEMLGYSKEEFADMSPQDIDASEESEKLPKIMEDLLDKGEKRFEMVHQTKDGHKVPVEIHSHVFELDGKGLALSIARDITERKKAEQNLKENQKKLKQLYDLAPKIAGSESLQELYELIVDIAKDILDFDVCSVEIEDNGELVVRASTEKELIDEYSLSVEEGIAGKTYREGESLLLEHIKEHDEARPTDSSFRSGISIPMGDIGVFQALSYEEDYFDEEDLELGELFVSYVTESINRLKAVQALKESEDKYRTLVETSFVGVGMTDFENDLTFVNDRMAEMLGYEKEELEGKNLADISTEKGMKKFEQNNKKRKEGITSHYESQLVKKDGKVIDVLVSGAPFKNADGEFVGTIGVMLDITERKKVQEREEFLHTLLRHDLKNKIQVIQGYIQLIEDEDLSKTVRDFVEKALKGIREGADLIDKIRLLREAQEEEKKTVKISKAVKEAVENNRDIAKDNGMTIETDCDLKGCEVEGGPLLIEVFSNLLENSIYHSGGEKIRMAEEVLEDEIKFTIEDDGKGISDDLKGKLFERGFRDGEKSGSGLGLYIVKEILGDYGGKIEVDDSELGGARFEIYLQKTG
ncbi:MAG: PAS domain S-box protein [Thermoplasmata archaeon]